MRFTVKQQRGKCAFLNNHESYKFNKNVRDWRYELQRRQNS